MTQIPGRRSEFEPYYSKGHTSAYVRAYVSIRQHATDMTQIPDRRSVGEDALRMLTYADVC